MGHTCWATNCWKCTSEERSKQQNTYLAIHQQTNTRQDISVLIHHLQALSTHLHCSPIPLSSLCLTPLWPGSLSSFSFYLDSSSLPFSCWSSRPSAELPSLYTSTGCWLYFSQRSLLNLIIIVWVFLTHLIVQTLGAFLYEHTLQLYHTGAQFICVQAGLAWSQFISWSQLQEEKGKVLIRAFLTATNETAGGSSVKRNWGISIQKFGRESPWNSCTVYFLLTRRLHKWRAALKRLYNALGLVYSHMCHNLAH